MSEVKNALNQKNLLKVKEQLLTRKRQLEGELQTMYTEKFSDEQIEDSADQALTSIMDSLRSTLQDKELQEYTMIMKALEKIENGQYGLCADCGQPISEKRLSVYPNATRCLACQEASEG